MLRNFGGSLASFQESLSIRKLWFGERSPHVANTLYSIGILYRDSGDFGNGMAVLKECLSIQQDSLGSGHGDCGSTFKVMGQVSYEMGDYCEALKLLQKALVFEQENNVSGHVDDLVEIHRCLGLVLEKLELHQDAVSHFEHCLSFERENLGDNDLSLSETMLSIGRNLKLLGNTKGALEWYRQSLTLKMDGIGEDASEVRDLVTEIKYLESRLKFGL
jgi:tetratricopeptide (TPR) repeat protein